MRYAVIGGEYRTFGNSYVYAELRANNSIDANGDEGDDVFTIGFHDNFSVRAWHKP